MPAPPQRTGWLTYVRCHDDIGWAIDDTDAATVGGDGQGHRDFLSAFYRGDFPMSFAEGEPFGVNLVTGDERTCGGTAALCGISQALRVAPGPRSTWACGGSSRCTGSPSGGVAYR